MSDRPGDKTGDPSGGSATRHTGSRWWRILRHRWYDEDDVRRVLDDAALQRVQARVAGSERGHSGEIRICVEASLPLSYLWRHAAPRERAVTMFGKLRVWDTEHNNGVLIYLLLAEHAIEIVADRGLSRHVPTAQWQQLAAGMAQAFRRGDYEGGLNAAVDAVGGLLDRHFPWAGPEANPNELPDAPVIQ